MVNSRKLEDLRSDVEANCRAWRARCWDAGLDVLVTGTVRDQAFQDDCVKRGTAPKGSVPTFHAMDAGLAFDFCKNVKGHEYDDLTFFKKAADIAKGLGFSWGGDWKKPDRPHLQWDDHGRFGNKEILAGNLPPATPEYGGAESSVTPHGHAPAASGWAAEAWDWAIQAGITDGTSPQGTITREMAVTMLHRALNQRS